MSVVECEYYDMSASESSDEEWTREDFGTSVVGLTMSDAVPGDEEWVQSE